MLVRCKPRRPWISIYACRRPVPKSRYRPKTAPIWRVNAYSAIGLLIVQIVTLIYPSWRMAGRKVSAYALIPRWRGSFGRLSRTICTLAGCTSDTEHQLSISVDLSDG